KIRDLYYELENPLLSVCVDMEENGFLLNNEKVDIVREKLYKEIEALEKKLVEIFGDINFNSPAQLSEVLYNKMKLPDVSGKRSTDKAILKKLAEKHKEVKLLLDYRKATKLVTAFIDKLPELVKST